jgi:hypothetical protein
MSSRRLVCQDRDQSPSRRLFLKRMTTATGLLASLKPCRSLARRAVEDSGDSPMPTISAMAEASRLFLDSLSPKQRTAALLPFNDNQRQDWHYIPKPRKGVPYRDLAQAQTQLANALLKTGLSRQGLLKTSNIVSLEPILHEIEQGNGPGRDSGLYYFCLFGAPESSKPWGWSFEGHHVSLNYTIMGDSTVASTPSFLGANPAEVPGGPRKGLRTLPSEEDLARTLVKSLDEKQRSQAVLSASAPADILSGHSHKADPISPAGLQVNRLQEKQADILMELVNEYARNMAPSIAAVRTGKLRSAGFGNLYFAWAGGFERGQPHYYRIQGPTFLIEYDNTQNNANHIHSVWRDFNGDFGADLLAEHYKSAHR